jgi:predicted membrane-bound spermidine synthase
VVGLACEIGGVRTIVLLTLLNAGSCWITGFLEAAHVVSAVEVKGAWIALLTAFLALAIVEVATHAFATWRIKGACYTVVCGWNTSLENA